MLKLSEDLRKSLKVTSTTMPDQQIGTILQTPGIFFGPGHYLYPAREGNRSGNHLDAVFLIEPIAANEQFIDWIVSDVCRWIQKENIQFEVIFAPAQPAVQKMVHKLAAATRAREAFWEYLPSGWFGDKLVSGEVKPGDRVLVFNAVTQQGRCVGERLPAFVEGLGGKPVAAAVFAKGTAGGVKAAEERYGPKFYASVQVTIGIETPEQCHICKKDGSAELIPWTQLRDNPPR